MLCWMWSRLNGRLRGDWQVGKYWGSDRQGGAGAAALTGIFAVGRVPADKGCGKRMLKNEIWQM